jgi:hypothetical protein
MSQQATVRGRTIVGRIRLDLEIDGRDCWTLFDSGARASYIRRAAVQGLPSVALPKPRRTRLGGAVHEIRESCLVPAKLDGHELQLQADVIDSIGQDEDGREIDILFGAIAMQLWGIRLDLPNERVDLSHFASEHVEF